MWFSYLKNNEGNGTIDFHPDAYYSSNPEDIARDVKEIVRRAQQLRLKQCRFICGKGIHNPRGELGVLRRRILAVLDEEDVFPYLDSNPRVDDEGGVIEVKFAWVEPKLEADELISRTKSRLNELPRYRTDNLDRVREMLRRVADDLEIPGSGWLGAIVAVTSREVSPPFLTTIPHLPRDISVSLPQFTLFWLAPPACRGI